MYDPCIITRKSSKLYMTTYDYHESHMTLYQYEDFFSELHAGTVAHFNSLTSRSALN